MGRTIGFSLLELLIVIAIASLLILGLAPAFGALIEHNRTRSAAQNLIRSMMLARTKAIYQHTRITLANPDGRWESGWIVFVDKNNNGLQESDETPLYQNAASQGVTIRGNSTVNRYVSYLPSGRAEHPNNAFQAGSIFVCAAIDHRHDYKIVLSIGGRVRLEEMPINSPQCTDPIN